MILTFIQKSSIIVIAKNQITMKKSILSLFVLLTLFSCNNEPLGFTEIDTELTQNIVCVTQDLGLTTVNITTPINTNNGIEEKDWYVEYTVNTVELFYYFSCGIECASKQYYVFDKTADCLTFSHAYTTSKDLYSPYTIVSETQQTMTFLLQEWVEDTKLVGEINYTDAASGNFIQKQFWIDILPSNFYVQEPYIAFNNCFGQQNPIAIDVNNDGINDFVIDYSTVTNTTATPNLESSPIILNSAQPENKILRRTFFGDFILEGDNTPYNTEFTGGPLTEATIATYKDYEAPYKNNNHWESTYLESFLSAVDFNSDYIIVTVNIDGLDYYGWINFSLDLANCTLIINNTYLSSTPNQHFIIN